MDSGVEWRIWNSLPRTFWCLCLLGVFCFQTVYAQKGRSGEGFISIDCGNQKWDLLEEGYGNLTWLKDRPEWIRSGQRMQTSGADLFEVPLMGVRRGLADVDATRRFFPTGTKNCYTIPASPGRYLVRLWGFHLAEIDEQLPSQGNPELGFDVAIGTTLVGTLAPYYNPFLEFVYLLPPQLPTIDVCLIRKPGGIPPFLNSLELRPMGELYPEATTSTVLALWKRFNCGLFTNFDIGQNATVYPEDPLDRVWDMDLSIISTGTNPYFSPANATFNVAPSTPAMDVPEDSPVPAAIYNIVRSTGATGLKELNYTLEYSSNPSPGQPPPQNPYILYLYFSEVELQVEPGDRIFDILINNKVMQRGVDVGGYGKVRNFKFPLTAAFVSNNGNPLARSRGNGAFVLTLRPSLFSPYGTAISGLEYYELVPISQGTWPDDVRALKSILASLTASGNLENEPALLSWAGDPCRPVPWDMVECAPRASSGTGTATDANNNSSSSSYVITALRMDGRQLNGSIPVAIVNLTSLRYLHLQNNRFVGSFPELMSTNITEIRVDNNSLSGPLPLSLLKNLQNLSILNVSANEDITGDAAVVKALVVKLNGNFSYEGTALEFNRATGTAITKGPSEAPPNIDDPSRERGVGRAEGSRNSREMALVIGGPLAGIVLLLAATAVICLCRCRAQASKKRNPLFSSIVARSSSSNNSGNTPDTAKTEVHSAKKKLMMMHKHQAQVGGPLTGGGGEGVRYGHGGRIFSMAELETATSNWAVSNIIGVGGFGVVYKGTFGDDGRVMAIKKRSSSSLQGEKEFYNEVNLLSLVRHKHLVPLVGYCHEGQQQILVYEFMANGTLREHLYDDKGEPLGLLNWRTRLGIALGAARGLEYLHNGSDPSIIHRDIKTSNILLDSNLMAKVADFGLSKLGPEGLDTHVSTAVKGTAGYLDPEYYTVRQLTNKSDVFSFGVVLLELITGREPINHSRPRPQWNIVEWARPALQAGNLRSLVDPTLQSEWSMGPMWKVAEIGIMCVEPHGDNRPSMADVVRELKEAVDMEFGVDNYIMMGPRVENNAEAGDFSDGGARTNVALDVEAR